MNLSKEDARKTLDDGFIYGSVVTIREKYKRICEYRGEDTWKIWKPVSFVRSGCIYLGKRILQNGARYYDSDYGYEFKPREYINVAMVSPSQALNIVYVPFESIELSEIQQF